MGKAATGEMVPANSVVYPVKGQTVDGKRHPQFLFEMEGIVSGGYFNYQQYKIEDIADAVQSLIDSNDATDVFGQPTGFNPETIREFESAVKCLRKAFVYAHRIDWLVSSDDGEDTFHERLARALLEIEGERDE